MYKKQQHTNDKPPKIPIAKYSDTSIELLDFCELCDTKLVENELGSLESDEVGDDELLVVLDGIGEL